MFSIPMASRAEILRIHIRTDAGELPREAIPQHQPGLLGQGHQHQLLPGQDLYFAAGAYRAPV